jgi:hypothetical protein
MIPTISIPCPDQNQTLLAGGKMNREDQAKRACQAKWLAYMTRLLPDSLDTLNNKLCRDKQIMNFICLEIELHDLK